MPVKVPVKRYQKSVYDAVKGQEMDLLNVEKQAMQYDDWQLAKQRIHLTNSEMKSLPTDQLT